MPVIVQWDGDTPRFTVNDAMMINYVLETKRCGVCGQLLKDNMWFVSGPVAAMTVHGVYLDPPSHKDCAIYSLKVCPYLGRVSYGSDGTGPRRVAERMGLTVAEVEADAHIKGRPEVFCLTKARTYAWRFDLHGGHKIKPKRPWLAMELWRHGERISREDAAPFLQARFAELASMVDA